MNQLFKKELAIFQMFKKIQLRDLNLGGAALAFIIVFIDLLTDRTGFIPTIYNQTSMIAAAILLVSIMVYVKDKTELQAFICIQISLLLINILLESIFPLSIFWLKAFICLYFSFNYFIFIIYSLHKQN